jgi:osmotically inducible lipoprotein OsmB
VGAAVGGVAGSVLTDQSTLGTVGGAVAGGVLGRGRGC